jgi:hypothetical protein
MNVRAAKMNADRSCRFPLDGEHFTLTLQTAARLVRNFGNLSSREIVMYQRNSQVSRLAFAAAGALALSAGSAFASQGPGGGMGAASSLTQIVMAVIVYGASALVIGTGLIGALRRR